MSGRGVSRRSGCCRADVCTAGCRRAGSRPAGPGSAGRAPGEAPVRALGPLSGALLSATRPVKSAPKGAVRPDSPLCHRPSPGKMPPCGFSPRRARPPPSEHREMQPRRPPPAVRCPLGGRCPDGSPPAESGPADTGNAGCRSAGSRPAGRGPAERAAGEPAARALPPPTLPHCRAPPSGRLPSRTSRPRRVLPGAARPDPPLHLRLPAPGKAPPCEVLARQGATSIGRRPAGTPGTPPPRRIPRDAPGRPPGMPPKDRPQCPTRTEELRTPGLVSPPRPGQPLRTPAVAVSVPPRPVSRPCGSCRWPGCPGERRNRRRTRAAPGCPGPPRRPRCR